MSNQSSKFVKFLRNNAALLIVIFTALAILAVILALSLGGGDTVPVSQNPDAPQTPTDKPAEETPAVKDPEPEQPTFETVKVYYARPVAFTSLGMEFTDAEDTLFVYNKTLNQYAVHYALDLIAEEGSDVCAMYDGTVTAVSSSYGLGNAVTIDHGNGVVATYASLGEVTVVKGQVVEKGDKIGTVSTSAFFECSDGAHLHLSVSLNGASVDPTPYVNGEHYVEVQKAI